jgi:hypothetical protein
MPAKTRHADALKAMGFAAEIDDFRRALAEVKAERFPDLTDEELCFTRDEAGEDCGLISEAPQDPETHSDVHLGSRKGSGTDSEAQKGVGPIPTSGS